MVTMKTEDSCIPIAEFKANAKAHLAALDEREGPLLITQNGKAVGVLLSPRAYDRMHTQLFRKSVELGIMQADAGMGIPSAQVHAEARAAIAARAAARNAARKTVAKSPVAAKLLKRK